MSRDRTIADALAWAAGQLREGESPRLDAEVLLAFLLGTGRSHLRAWPERTLSRTTATRLRALVAERAAGRPVAHLTGQREFWSLPLRVTRDTLVPRPETEHLVEAALERLRGSRRPAVLDLGTGSGAVALAIAAERPDARVTAVERCPGALAVARCNARVLGLERVRFLAGDWFEPVRGERFDLIAANPPYIAASEPELARGDIRFEPHDALVADADGLADLRRIALQAPAHLSPGGGLVVEHGWRQGPAVRRLLQAAGLSAVGTRCDLQGCERVTLGCAGYPSPREVDTGAASRRNPGGEAVAPGV